MAGLQQHFISAESFLDNGSKDGHPQELFVFSRNLVLAFCP